MFFSSSTLVLRCSALLWRIQLVLVLNLHTFFFSIIFFLMICELSSLLGLFCLLDDSWFSISPISNNLNRLFTHSWDRCNYSFTKTLNHLFMGSNWASSAKDWKIFWDSIIEVRKLCVLKRKSSCFENLLCTIDQSFIALKMFITQIEKFKSKQKKCSG